MQKVMITGIAGGFGKPTALALLEQGYQVAGSVPSRKGKSAETVAELEVAGASIVEMDVTDTASTERGMAEMLEATPDQRPERIAEAVVSVLDKPFGQMPFRTVVDYLGVGPQIERYNDVLHDVTRTVMTSFGIEDMLKLNA